MIFQRWQFMPYLSLAYWGKGESMENTPRLYCELVALMGQPPQLKIKCRNSAACVSQRSELVTNHENDHVCEAKKTRACYSLTAEGVEPGVDPN